jgi:hypothetical protein
VGPPAAKVSPESAHSPCDHEATIHGTRRAFPMQGSKTVQINIDEIRGPG